MHLLRDADVSGGPSTAWGALGGNGPTYQTYGTLAENQASSLARNWRAAAHIWVINTATDCGTAVQFSTVETPASQERLCK